jgi:hypothetical protein
MTKGCQYLASARPVRQLFPGRKQPDNEDADAAPVSGEKLAGIGPRFAAHRRIPGLIRKQSKCRNYLSFAPGLSRVPHQ